MCYQGKHWRYWKPVDGQSILLGRRPDQEELQSWLVWNILALLAGFWPRRWRLTTYAKSRRIWRPTATPDRQSFWSRLTQSRTSLWQFVIWNGPLEDNDPRLSIPCNSHYWNFRDAGALRYFLYHRPATDEAIMSTKGEKLFAILKEIAGCRGGGANSFRLLWRSGPSRFCSSCPSDRN